MHNIFVYGTLQSTEIVKKLTGKTFKVIPAVLPGYKRFCVKSCDYPAVIPDDNAETDGLLLEKVDDFSLKIISFFEGEEYQKVIIPVCVEGLMKNAIAFTWNGESEKLENREWAFRRFEEEFLEYYLEVVIPETLEEFNSK